MSSTDHFLSICLLFSVTIAIVRVQTLINDHCTSKVNCSECIQAPSCSWCLDPKYNKSRCLWQERSVEVCTYEFIINPDNVLSVIQNTSLTRTRAPDDDAGSQKVQLAPQKLSLKLRKGRSYSISTNFAETDAPVDLYYLMDFSMSMQDDQQKLIDVSNELVETMKQLSSDFRLGFGSFVDKVVMPYVSTLPQNLQQPCPGCAAPYGFKHAMKLSDNTSQFAHIIRNTKISGNLDRPEGGFDAIVQVAECKDQIGWRSNAKKLLVFSTDASSHVAGDGKLGGIVEPNDGLCHLSSEGIYTESSSQDYPSIAQVDAILKKNSINIIFAVTDDVRVMYNELARKIEGATVGVLKEDSSNIVDLVKEQYHQISSKVQIKHNASSDVSLKFYSRCSNASGDLMNTDTCDKVKPGETIEFRIDIQLLQCPKNRSDYFQTIKIYPVGIEESLIIDLELICECDCEKPTSKWYEERSPRCSSHGTYKCGECYCDSESFGRNCECVAPRHYPWQPDCAIPGHPICSGRGQCVCGQCECFPRPNYEERIYGKYCECDNFSCERHEGKLCSGHGTCDCGSCVCEPGWMGSNCACSTNTTSCYSHGGVHRDLICSGRGQCVCGLCFCQTTEEGRYTGQFCEKRPAKLLRHRSIQIKQNILYSEKVVIFSTAAPYARVAQPTLLDNSTNFTISELTENEKIFAITKDEGIIYVDNFQGLKHSPEYVNLNVSWTRNNHREFDEIQVRIINEPNETCGDTTDLSNWTFCSKYETSNDCLGSKSCGIGTGGAPSVAVRKGPERCMWRGDKSSSNITYLYSTCTPDMDTCPNGICDSLEELHSLICPQDCTTDVVFPAMKNPKTGRGIDKASGVVLCNSLDKCSISFPNKNKKPKMTKITSTVPPLQIQPNISEPTYNHTTAKFLNKAKCGKICILSIVGSIFSLGCAIAIVVVCWKLDRVNREVRAKNNEEHHQMTVPLSNNS